MVIKTGRRAAESDELVLCLDFGGTKLAATIVDLGLEKIVGPVIRQQTPVSEGASGTLLAMLACGRQALQACGQAHKVSAVGISFGGPVSADRRSVLLSNHVADWNGAPLVEQVSQAFQLPAAMDNDGNVAALGEWWFGGHRQVANLAYIQVSTGVGGGFVLGRQPYRGAGLAGEMGHYGVDANGPLCSCGRHGCLEALSSGWAIARDGRLALAKGAQACPELARLCGNRAEAVTAELVFVACRAGDAACQAIIQAAFRSLAMMITNLVTCIDPELVVIGGGLVRSVDIFERYFFPELQERMHPFFKDRCRVELSRMDGAELLLGAALLTRE